MSYHDGHEPDPDSSFCVEQPPARWLGLRRLLALAATLGALASWLL